MTIPCPWQLYTFSAVNVIGSFFMYGWVYDPCLLLTGDAACKVGAETYSARAMAVCFLYVGVFFAALTYINRRNAPKLKRLANMGLNCAMALLVGIIFTGSRKLGGVERSILHLLDMITGFVLLLIMISAIADSSEMADKASPLTGLGINPKAFVLLVWIVVVLKLFAVSDFIDPSYFLADPDSVTELSQILWTWMGVMLLEILFPLAFSLAYGDEKDQETITFATLVMMVVSVVSFLPMMDTFSESVMKTGYISLCVFVVLAILAVVGGRCTRRQEYEAVSNVSVVV